MRRAVALAALVLLGSCQREEREIGTDQSAVPADPVVVLSPLSPGGGRAATPPTETGRDYEGNALHLANGKRLFGWYNCTGCHGNGGGGSGPALMDDVWLYGSAIENIVATIREGRPNGMPSFRGRVTDSEIWELAAYIRSMSGNVPKDAAPSRDDDLSGAPSENRRDPIASPQDPSPPEGQ